MMAITEKAPAAEVKRKAVHPDEWLPPEEYNFDHFRTRHLLFDVSGTVKERGIRPGEMAPDFELPQANGEPVRLSRLRGRPTLLHFGSFT
jgi:hypothetical protein